MEAVFGVALLWLAFAGTHVGLATRRVRPALVARLGEWGFVAVFSAVASITYAALVHFYATHRLEGPPGLALGASDAPRAVLIAIVFLGIVLAVAALSSYPASPYAIGNAATRAPRGLEKITRHPFFAGMAAIGAAHALLATHLVGTLFFAALSVYALLGAAHQDRKLLAQRGRPYAEFLAATSLLPFVAILAGRQKIAWRELPRGGLAQGAIAAIALFLVHDSIFAAGGAWVIGLTVGGAASLTFRSWRRATSRAARRSPGVPLAGSRPPAA